MTKIRFGLITGIWLIGINCFYSNAQSQSDYYRQSSEKFMHKKYEDALVAINKAINLDTSKAEYYVMRAEIAYRLGNFNKTIEDCYKAQSLHPDMPDVYFLRAEVCLITKSYRGAMLFFNKAIERYTEKDKLFKSYISRGKVYAAMEKYSEAIGDFMKADSLWPDSLSQLTPLADSYIKLNKLPEAEFILERILDRDAENVIANKLYGDIYFDRKNYERAAHSYENYVLYKPNDISVLNKLAQSFMLQKKYEKAILYINKSLSQDTKNPETNKIRGLLFLAIDNKEEGCNCLFRALEQGYIDQYGYDLLEIYTQNCEDN